MGKQFASIRTARAMRAKKFAYVRTAWAIRVKNIVICSNGSSYPFKIVIIVSRGFHLSCLRLVARAGVKKCKSFDTSIVLTILMNNCHGTCSAE